MFTDSHCHLYKEYYNDISDILENAEKCNVNRFINNGCDSNSNKEVIESTHKYPTVYGAIGIHPENVASYNIEDLNYIEENLKLPKIIAIGEIGLDYHYTKDNKEEQINLFTKQLFLAEKYQMPVIIHSREATLDTINILKKFKLKGIIHSFSGSLETAKEYIKMGYLIGVNGVVTFKNSHIKEVIKKIPLEKIVLETDSPYLTPEPFRGTQNSPSHIIEIAKYIADLKNISMSELSRITNNNLDELFNLKSNN